MLSDNLEALVALKGDCKLLMDHFKERYFPMEQYKESVHLSKSTIIIVGLQSVKPDDTLEYYKVVNGNIEKIDETEFTESRKEAIKLNSEMFCLNNKNVNTPIHFMTVS